jgi:hypothetical protein
MIAVAAFAVAAALCPFTCPASWSDLGWYLRHREWIATAYFGTQFLAPWLIVGALALLVIKLRFPREPWKKLLRRPSSSVCIVAALFVMATAVVDLSAGVSAILLRRGLAEPAYWIERYFQQVHNNAGFAIMAVWSFQAMSGSWRAENDWTDRFGRLLGTCWICSVLFSESLITFQLMSSET